MKIGHWKTTDVFYNHYVAARPGQDTTDRMLGMLDAYFIRQRNNLNSSFVSTSEDAESSADDSPRSTSQRLDTPDSTETTGNTKICVILALGLSMKTICHLMIRTKNLGQK
jgi:hypothetical protein